MSTDKPKPPLTALDLEFYRQMLIGPETEDNAPLPMFWVPFNQSEITTVEIALKRMRSGETAHPLVGIEIDQILWRINDAQSLATRYVFNEETGDYEPVEKIPVKKPSLPTWEIRDRGTYWQVSDGSRMYECNSEDDAKWLKCALNIIRKHENT